MKQRIHLFSILALSFFFLGSMGCNDTSKIVALSSIAITPATSTLFLGSTQQFTLTGTYADGSTANLSSQALWNSSDTSVATLSIDGNLSAINAGSSTITASIGSLTSNSVNLSVILIFAAGYSNASNLLPLAYSSSDAGSTWDLAPTFTLPTGQVRGVLNEIVCVENNCTAVGLSFTSVQDNYLPLAYFSTDGGSTWTMAPDFSLPVGQAQGTLNNVTCSSNICTSTGQSYNASLLNQQPLAYVSMDNGATWTLSTAFTLPAGQTQGLMGDTSCEGSQCTSVGFSYNTYGTDDLPMAYTSDNSGSTWTLSPTFTLPAGQTQAQLLAVTCDEEDCAAVGVSFTNGITDNIPLAYTSNDGGSTWTLSPAFTLPQATGFLTDVFCQDDHCVAVGSSASSAPLDLPLAYTSNDNGSTWTLVAAFPLPTGQAQGLLNAVYCAEEVCFAQGGSNDLNGDNELPLSYMSSDGGTTWALNPPFTLPEGQTEGLFE